MSTMHTTRQSITDRQINLLRRESAEAGDLRMAAICELALGADGTEAEPGTELAIAATEHTCDSARGECVRAIRDAEANE